MTKKASTHGFTIVELLIVIVVIAVLATITTVAYNGISQRANASAASSGLTQAKKKLEVYKVENGTYPATGNLAAAGVTSTSVSYQYTSNGTTYCLTGTASTVSYKATDATAPSAGGCAGHGVGGVEAVTNLATDPAATGGNWIKVVNTGDGTGTFQSSGGPAGVPTFFRLTITTVPTGAVPYLVYGGNQAGHRVQPVASQPFTASAWIRSNRAVSVRLLFVASSVGGVEWNVVSASATTVLTPNAWTRISHQVSSWPATSNHAATRILFETANAVPGFWAVSDTLDVTGLMAASTSSNPGYADGNSPSWVWSGTPNASTSTGPPL
jgi:prepilin-type N-terminal cleavage/methylation domain-containing protein